MRWQPKYLFKGIWSREHGNSMSMLTFLQTIIFLLLFIFSTMYIILPFSLAMSCGPHNYEYLGFNRSKSSSPHATLLWELLPLTPTCDKSFTHNLNCLNIRYKEITLSHPYHIIFRVQYNTKPYLLNDWHHRYLLFSRKYFQFKK
jgi:hypothetical protein